MNEISTAGALYTSGLPLTGIITCKAGAVIWFLLRKRLRKCYFTKLKKYNYKNTVAVVNFASLKSHLAFFLGSNTVSRQFKTTCSLAVYYSYPILSKFANNYKALFAGNCSFHCILAV